MTQTLTPQFQQQGSIAGRLLLLVHFALFRVYQTSPHHRACYTHIMTPKPPLVLQLILMILNRNNVCNAQVRGVARACSAVPCRMVKHGAYMCAFHGTTLQDASSWQATAFLIVLVCCTHRAMLMLTGMHLQAAKQPKQNAGQHTTQRQLWVMCTAVVAKAAALYSLINAAIQHRCCADVVLHAAVCLSLCCTCACHDGQSSTAMPQLPFRSHGLGSDGYLRLEEYYTD